MKSPDVWLSCICTGAVRVSAVIVCREEVKVCFAAGQQTLLRWASQMKMWVEYVSWLCSARAEKRRPAALLCCCNDVLTALACFSDRVWRSLRPVWPRWGWPLIPDRSGPRTQPSATASDFTCVWWHVCALVLECLHFLKIYQKCPSQTNSNDNIAFNKIKCIWIIIYMSMCTKIVTNDSRVGKLLSIFTHLSVWVLEWLIFYSLFWNSRAEHGSFSECQRGRRKERNKPNNLKKKFLNQ